MGCGAPDAELQNPESARTITTETNAVEAATDAVVASAVMVNHDAPALWVFVCDRSQRLIRDKRNSPTAAFFTTPEILDTGCASVPVVEPVQLGPNLVVRVWVRHTDNKLYVHTFDASSTAVSVDNVSDITGFGPIAGTPVPMGYQIIGPDYYYTIAVRSGSSGDYNRLHTIVERDSGGGQAWSYQHVLKLNGFNLNTQNTVNTSSDVFANMVLTGRGTYSADDADAGWVAEPTNPADPNSQYVISYMIPGMTGTPTFGDTATSQMVVAPFGFTIKSAPIHNTTFTAMSGCSTSGSPNGSRNVGYIRGKSGDLVKYDLTTNSCVTKNINGAVKLASAPNIVGNYQGHHFGFENDAFYKGVDGFLHYYDASDDTHTVLPILL